MGCSKHYEDLIDKYIEGLVTLEEKELLESHMEVCHDCRQEAKELQKIIKASASLGQVELPVDLKANLMEKINTLSYQQRSHEKSLPLLKLIRNIPELLYAYIYHNKRIFVGALSVFLIGIFVVTAYNQGVFDMNYATNSVKEEAVSESAPADMSSMMTMDGAGTSGWMQSEGESIAQVPSTNMADTRLKTFSAEEKSQKIIKNADLSIYVEKFDEKVDYIIKTVEELGGYIEHSQIQGGKSIDSPRRAYMALRIPQAKLNDALDIFKTLGRVTNNQISGENITDAYYDTDARIRNLVQQEQRLLEILNMANTIDEILRIEIELNRVRTDIDMLKGQLMAWDKMVEMSLVNVNLIEQEPSKEKVTTVTPLELMQRARQGFITAINISMNMLAFLAELTGALLPVALILGILYLLIRRVLSKRKKG
ncbi:MAG TPA: DUF4349 domain-containing protein [Tepidanaerobacteraceae bacterium]|nr:DUF4349 domain-containing protein [Tepidanaerobacteraceae bacterium]